MMLLNLAVAAALFSSVSNVVAAPMPEVSRDQPSPPLRSRPHVPPQVRPPQVRHYCKYQPAAGVAPTPFEVTITNVNAQRTTVKLKFLGRGSFGCVYDVVGGYPAAAVAKTPLIRGEVFEEVEIEALEDIKELYLQGATDDGQAWMLMKKHSGKTLFDTPAWKARFPARYNSDFTPEGIDACETFMTGIYGLIVARWREYIEASKPAMDAKGFDGGWWQNDFNVENFLFNPGLTEVNIIDWGHATLEDGDEDWENFVMEQFVNESPIPLKDYTKSSGVLVPGICSSESRRSAAHRQNRLSPAQA